MDNESGRRGSGNAPRAPPGLLGGNLVGHHGVSPPPGLMPPPFMHPSSHQPCNNNVFFPMQSPLPGYALYPSPPPPSYEYYDKCTQGGGANEGLEANGNANGNHHQVTQQHAKPVKTTFFPGAAPRQFSSLDQTPTRADVSEPVRTSTGVIEPMIENLVGSMGNSGGTYSHFGPSNTSILTGISFGQVSQENSNFLARQTSSPVMSTPAAEFQLINTDPFNSSPEWEFQRKMETRIRQKQLLQKQQQAPVPFGENRATNVLLPTSNGRGFDQTLPSNAVPQLDNLTPPPRPETPGVSSRWP